MYSHLESVEHTIDSQGFVLVAGVRVLNVQGHNLKTLFAPTSTTCQRCGGRVPQPMRVVCEYEAAFDAVRYFHAPVPNTPTRCASCQETG